MQTIQASLSVGNGVSTHSYDSRSYLLRRVSYPCGVELSIDLLRSDLLCEVVDTLYLLVGVRLGEDRV